MNQWKSLKDLVSSWWVLLIIGILCVVAGIACLFNPAAGFLTVSTIVALAFTAAGILRIIFVIANRDRIPAWGWDLVGAIIMTIAGFCLFGGTGMVFVYIFYAAGFIGGGISGIVRSISMRKVEGSHWILSLIFSILAVCLGIFFVLNPAVAMLNIGFLAGFSMIFNGVNFIVTSIGMSKTKSAMNRVEDAYNELRK